jgi:RNA polymerase sigma-70 factor, ECF subfamily
MGPKHGVVALEHSAGDALRDVAGPRGSGVGAEQALAEPIDFARLYEAHFDFVWRSLRLLGVPAEAIEDVVQDTFDIVSRQLGQFEGRSSLRTWLFAIAQRVAANYRRMARRKLSQLDPLSDCAPSAEPTPQAHVEAREAAGVVERFVEGLDAEWRAVFVLAVLEGVPGGEVAGALGISVNAVYTRVHTLREGLRRAFERGATQRPARGAR